MIDKLKSIYFTLNFIHVCSVCASAASAGRAMRAVSIVCKCESMCVRVCTCACKCKSMCAAMAIGNRAKAQGICKSESVCSKGVCKCKCKCKCLRKCGDGGQHWRQVKGAAEDGSELCTCLTGWESLLSGVPRRVVGGTRAEEGGGDLRVSVQ